MFALLCSVGAQVARAQTATIRGFVTDEADGQLLPGVNVSVEDGAGGLTGAATNLDGFYTIAGVPVGRYILRVSFVGYHTFVDTLDVASGTVQVDGELVEATIRLDEDTVESERAGGGARLAAGRGVRLMVLSA